MPLLLYNYRRTSYIIRLFHGLGLIFIAVTFSEKKLEALLAYRPSYICVWFYIFKYITHLKIAIMAEIYSVYCAITFSISQPKIWCCISI
jgi:hypothetical protein